MAKRGECGERSVERVRTEERGESGEARYKNNKVGRAGSCEKDEGGADGETRALLQRVEMPI